MVTVWKRQWSTRLALLFNHERLWWCLGVRKHYKKRNCRNKLRRNRNSFGKKRITQQLPDDGLLFVKMLTDDWRTVEWPLLNSVWSVCAFNLAPKSSGFGCFSIASNNQREKSQEYRKIDFKIIIWTTKRGKKNFECKKDNDCGTETCQLLSPTIGWGLSRTQIRMINRINTGKPPG